MTTRNPKPYCFMVKSKTTGDTPPKIHCGFLGFHTDETKAKDYLNSIGLGHFEIEVLIEGYPGPKLRGF